MSEKEPVVVISVALAQRIWRGIADAEHRLSGIGVEEMGKSRREIYEVLELAGFKSR